MIVVYGSDRAHRTAASEVNTKAKTVTEEPGEAHGLVVKAVGPTETEKTQSKALYVMISFHSLPCPLSSLFLFLNFFLSLIVFPGPETLRFLLPLGKNYRRYTLLIALCHVL